MCETGVQLASRARIVSRRYANSDSIFLLGSKPFVHLFLGDDV